MLRHDYEITVDTFSNMHFEWDAEVVFIGMLSKVSARIYVTGKLCNQAFCEMPKYCNHLLK